MSAYQDYLKEIEERKGMGLSPKPIFDAELLTEIISQINDQGNEHRKGTLDFFI